MQKAPVEPGELIAGKYRVERVLGEGGMGVVVSAQHLELEQRVAVKFLLAEVAKQPDAAERFRREARAAVKIRSEHVVRVLDVGTTAGGIPYMVMEHLDGHDLAAELQGRGSLSVGEAVAYVLQACEAVAEAHAAGIVHRDLKPANLFLAQRADGTRSVKVLDFGISKSVGATSASDLSLTRTSALIGSPLYMSPEHMHSAKSVDARTDIWSLGAILYECLAGRPPFVADSMPGLIAAVLSDALPPISSFRPDVPRALVDVIARALEKDRARRWSDVGELALALSEFAPEARIHATRAARVVATNDGQGRVVPGTHPTAGDEALALQPTVAAEVRIADHTFDSWGKTGGSAAPTDPPKRGGRRLVLLGAAVSVVAIVIAVGVARTTVAPSTSAASVSANAEPSTTPASTEPTLDSAPTAVDASAPSPSGPAPASAHRDRPLPAAPKHPAPPKPSSGLPDFGGRR